MTKRNWLVAKIIFIDINITTKYYQLGPRIPQTRGAPVPQFNSLYLKTFLVKK